ncbi:hypothetical protein M885DRAFT_506646 [Pelagophyceae sp. CCMP2097]|nr:hypothetical protein M885DRAFT_506646 [Pelagophyceae sp. CCMP2097]
MSSAETRATAMHASASGSSSSVVTKCRAAPSNVCARPSPHTYTPRVGRTSRRKSDVPAEVRRSPKRTADATASADALPSKTQASTAAISAARLENHEKAASPFIGAASPTVAWTANASKGRATETRYAARSGDRCPRAAAPKRAVNGASNAPVKAQRAATYAAPPATSETRASRATRSAVARSAETDQQLGLAAPPNADAWKADEMRRRQQGSIATSSTSHVETPRCEALRLRESRFAACSHGSSVAARTPKTSASSSASSTSGVSDVDDGRSRRRRRSPSPRRSARRRSFARALRRTAAGSLALSSRRSSTSSSRTRITAKTTPLADGRGVVFR